MTPLRPVGSIRGIADIEDHPPENPKEGDKMHSYMEGWMIYYGNEWIPIHIWWKIKIKGL